MALSQGSETVELSLAICSSFETDWLDLHSGSGSTYESAGASWMDCR